MKNTWLKSNILFDNEEKNVCKEFVMPGSVCVTTSSKNVYDTVWFVKIKSTEEKSDKIVIDDYGNKIYQVKVILLQIMLKS